MRKKTEAELRRAGIIKTTRTLVRLKHSLRVDEELNELLPETLREFDEALARGELHDVIANLEDVTS